MMADLEQALKKLQKQSKKYSEDGVAIFMDLGSAVMTTEMVLESMEDRKIKMVDCPVAEGTIAAAVVAAGGASLEEVVQVAQASKEQAKF